ncbi:MAG: hypothetical protein WCD31_00505, partial [Gillisia sp.]
KTALYEAWQYSPSDKVPFLRRVKEYSLNLYDWLRKEVQYRSIFQKEIPEDIRWPMFTGKKGSCEELGVPL